MKNLLPLLLILMIACGGQKLASENVAIEKIPTPSAEPTLKLINAATVIKGFKDANFPVIDEIQYTEETDTNNLLGRPGQYIDKINFSDKRTIGKAQKQGNSIEVFKTKEDLERRKNYTETISRSGSIFLQYIYSHKNILLRLDHQLLPKDAAEYERILKTL